MSEIWKDVEQKGVNFRVSSQGEIIALPREVVYSDGRVFHYPERKVKFYKDHRGYDIFVMTVSQKEINFKVHQVIAYAFPEICGDHFPGAQVNHKNENKTDNRAENLEWCSGTYNINYGTCIERAREKKLNSGGKQIAQYDLNGALVKIYPSMREAERETKVGHTEISRCCTGDRNKKTAGGYIWKYA